MSNASSGPSGSQPIRVPILNILIDRKTDILAAVALLLAISSAIVQVVFFLRGADVSFVPPDRLFLIFEPVRHHQSQDFLVRVAAEMGYYNSGTLGYDEVVRGESVSFKLADRRYVQTAIAEYKFSDENFDSVLERELINASRMVPVKAGSAVSRQVYFAPHPVRCEDPDECKPYSNYLYYVEFLNALNNISLIDFSFSAELSSGKEQWMDTCTVDVGQGIIDQLTLNGWAVVPCWYDEEQIEVTP